MKIYRLSLTGYETYHPIDLYHENEYLNFDSLVTEAYIKVIEQLLEGNEDNHHILLEDATLLEIVARYLVDNSGFIHPKIDEVPMGEFTFFGPLYSDPVMPSGGKHRILPHWIPKTLQDRMFEATKKYLEEDKEE